MDNVIAIKPDDNAYEFEATVPNLQSLEARVAQLYLELGPAPKMKELQIARVYLDRCMTCLDVAIAKCDKKTTLTKCQW